MGFLVEKHQGYHYEHALTLNWHAMHSDHLLMRLAHTFNTMARFTRQWCCLYQELAVQGRHLLNPKLLRHALA